MRRHARLRRTACESVFDWTISEDQCQTIVAIKSSAVASIWWVGEFRLLQTDGSFLLKSTDVSEE